MVYENVQKYMPAGHAYPELGEDRHKIKQQWHRVTASYMASTVHKHRLILTEDGDWTCWREA